jgi:hypothetical protein
VHQIGFSSREPLKLNEIELHATLHRPDPEPKSAIPLQNLTSGATL